MEYGCHFSCQNRDVPLPSRRYDGGLSANNQQGGLATMDAWAPLLTLYWQTRPYLAVSF
jgi:hypothetical protein